MLLRLEGNSTACIAQSATARRVRVATRPRRAPACVLPKYSRLRPGTLFWLLTNGVVRRGMPVWSKLPEPQRWQIVSYIKSLSGPPKTKAEPDKTPAIGASGGN